MALPYRFGCSFVITFASRANSVDEVISFVGNSHSVDQFMLYLSQVLSRPIRDLEGERVAITKDVIVRLGEVDHPPVTGLVARYRRRDFFLSRWRVAELNEQGVWL